MPLKNPNRDRIEYECGFLIRKLRAEFNFKDIDYYHYLPNSSSRVSFANDLSGNGCAFRFNVPYPKSSQKISSNSSMKKNVTYPQIEKVIYDFSNIFMFKPDSRNYACNYLFTQNTNFMALKVNLDWSDKDLESEVEISVLRGKQI